MTELFFFLGDQSDPMDSGHPLWNAPLPVSRPDQSPSLRPDAQTLAYRQYFSAVEHFLSGAGRAALVRGAAQILARPVDWRDIGRVVVRLVKHGQYYHPAKLTLSVGANEVSMVLNVAVSDLGRSIMAAEVQHLNELNRQLPVSFLPTVFGHGQICLSPSQHLSMFCAQWLDGFCEFHLTDQAPAPAGPVVVWLSDDRHRFLDRSHCGDLLVQAAQILAYYYNPLTLTAIQHWHHAAGDFVVRCRSDRLDVRLISVRRYDVLLAAGPNSTATAPDERLILDMLAIFWVQTSLRLRLDRLDGVGNMVMYDDDMVAAICKGMGRGLALGASARGLPPAFLKAVEMVLNKHGAAELSELGHALVQRMHPDSEERRALEPAVERHAKLLAGRMRIPYDD